MADKKSAKDNKTPETPDNSVETPSQSSSELDTLRQIVFGTAQNNIEKRIDALEQQTKDSFNNIEQLLEKSMKSLQTSMEEGFNQLEDKLALADQGQDEKASELNAYADKIASELEMAEANSKQEKDELHDRLDKEIKALTIKFTEQLEQALEKLTQMSNELNSSKTDRKTLAKLLASVASNLETGEDE